MRRGRKGAGGDTNPPHKEEKMETVRYQDAQPNFVEDHVLRSRQLECVRDFPREMASLRYEAYADGILFGCRVYADAAIVISAGVILRKGVFYRLTAPAAIPYGPLEETQYLKARFDPADTVEEDILKKNAEIVLDIAPTAKDEIELARFVLKEGARLRSDYTGFDDLDTAYDTLCVLHAPCAAPGGQTLLPFVTALFAEEALFQNPENPVDIQFAMLCLQSERVHPAVLRRYLGAAHTDLFGLYTALSEKLTALKKAKREEVKAPRTLRKILVD
jgi:hypothetical protein